MSVAVPARALSVLALIVALLATPGSAQAIGFNEGNCSGGQSADYGLGFFDDMESRVPGTFNHNALTGVDAWSYPATGHASSGDTVLHADDRATAGDSVVRTPIGTIGGSGLMRLRFTHTFEFENGKFDGGVVELSVNGGAFTDIGAGAYNGTIGGGVGNPLNGRAGFVESSGGPRPPFIQIWMKVVRGPPLDSTKP